MIICEKCKWNAVDCNCPDMGDRLKAAAAGSQAHIITKIIVARQSLGKDLPKKCSIEGCAFDPAFIPMVTVPAPRRINVKMIREVTCEMLNGPLCLTHKELAKLDHYINDQTVEHWRKHFHAQKLRQPIFSRARLEFRPIAQQPLIIAP